MRRTGNKASLGPVLPTQVIPGRGPLPLSLSTTLRLAPAMHTGLFHNPVVIRAGADADAGDAVDRGDNKTRFANVVMPHLDDAYGLARWVTGNRADAEDVVQEACLRAFRGIGGFAGGNGRAWVLTIVRNAAYDWLRKNRSPAVVQMDDLEAVERMQLADDTATSGNSPEAALIARADEAKLEAAIASLPAVFRETLVLRDVQGLDYREIAGMTGVPIGTVMSRLARARGRVIAMLGADT